MSKTSQKGTARFPYLALSTEFLDYITLKGQSILMQSVTEELNSQPEPVLLNFYMYTKNGGSFIRETKTITHHPLKSIKHDNHIVKYFNRPRRYIYDSKASKIMDDNQLTHRIGSIPLREDFQKFVIVTPKQRGIPIYLAYNCIFPKSLEIDFRLFEHYLEAEIVDEYVAYMLRGLVGSSLDVNKKNFSDPIDALESVLQKQHDNVPDIHHVLWLYDDDSDMRALMTSISTLDGFNQDFLADEGPIWNPVWRCFIEQEDVFIPNLSNDSELRFHENSDFLEHCKQYKQKSIMLTPLVVNASVVGVVGFFSRNYGDVLKAFQGFLHFVREIIIRHVAEATRLRKYIMLNQKLKELTPLMAIGIEVNERMHDIRDDINRIYNLFLTVENKKKYPDRKKIAKIGTEGVNIVEGIKTRLSKQLQIFKDAREKTRRTGLRDFFNGMIDKFKINANFSDAEILYKFDSKDEIFVSLQRFYFSRLLENLISNGCYFAKQRIDVRKPWVSVKVYQRRKLAVIEITDSGPGILQHPIDKIFEAGETSKPEGYGIGLTIVNRIIDDHSGKIEVFNGADYGAIFRIKLPINN